MAGPRDKEPRSRWRSLSGVVAAVAGVGIALVLGRTLGDMTREHVIGSTVGTLTFIVLYLAWIWWRDRRDSG
jgi:hypothetical protein